jgi:hypothetical protein
MHWIMVPITLPMAPYIFTHMGYLVGLLYISLRSTSFFVFGLLTFFCWTFPIYIFNNLEFLKLNFVIGLAMHIV